MTGHALLALRLLSEIHREFNRPLNVAYLDIKAAFDFVDRRALWKALRSSCIPDVLTDLIPAVHENTGAAIHVGKNKSARLETTLGVRQGCILAPALFTVAYILVTVRPNINIGSSSFSDLVYADDTTLMTLPLHYYWLAAWRSG